MSSLVLQKVIITSSVLPPAILRSPIIQRISNWLAFSPYARGGISAGPIQTVCVFSYTRGPLLLRGRDMHVSHTFLISCRVCCVHTFFSINIFILIVFVMRKNWNFYRIVWMWFWFSYGWNNPCQQNSPLRGEGGFGKLIVCVPFSGSVSDMNGSFQMTKSCYHRNKYYIVGSKAWNMFMAWCEPL